MNIDELVAKYPLIFTIEKYPSVSSGWIPLLDLLCDRLQSTTDEEVKKALKYNELYKQGAVGFEYPDDYIKSMQIECTQCKEKFGGLRFYTENGLGGKHFDIIHEYEILSYHVCESCSTMMDVGITKGWASTTCIDCKNKPEYKGREWRKNI